MQRATALPVNRGSYHDQVWHILKNIYSYNLKKRKVNCFVKYSLFSFLQSLSVQERLYKSLKVWLLYADLEEALGTFKVTIF